MFILFNESMFTHIHWHSTFSFLEAIGKPNKIIARAKELGMTAIGISDYNGMYSAIKFYQIAKEEGIKPIIGVEVGFVLDSNVKIQASQVGNIILIAKDKEWYQNLMILTSFANKEWIAGKPKIDINVLKTHGNWVIAIMGGGESRIAKMMTSDNQESKIIEILWMIQDAVGKENVYLDIAAQSYALLPEMEKINNHILEIAGKTWILCLVHNNFHYPRKDDKEAWEVALAIKDGKKMYDEDRRKPKGEYFIMSEEEIREVLEVNRFERKLIDEMIENNNNLAESINTEIDLNQALFPNYDTPDDIKEIYESVKDELVIKE